MQRYTGLVLLLAVGCSNESATGEASVSKPPTENRDGGLPPALDGAAPDPSVDGGGSSIGEPDLDPSALPNPGVPRMLSGDAIGIIGMTSDDHVVYRASDGLHAASVVEDGSDEVVSSAGGTVLIRGKSVFQWTEIDWTTNLGKLTIWSAENGVRAVGTAYYGEDAVAASAGDAQALYLVPKATGVADLMLATGDGEPVALLSNIGRGGEGTCRPSFGFVLEKAVVASCALGETGATLRLYAEPASGAPATEIATGIRPLWSSNWAGTRFFYVDEGARAFYWENDVAAQIDRGVAWGMILPDGETVLYTVSDQLRRTPVPNINPMPVVVNQFLVRSDWSPEYRHVLFSKELVYGGGTRRDLYLAATDAFNQVPTVLADEPEAKLSKSSFSSDGRWALYLTAMDDTGAGTLNARSVSGAGERTIAGVDTVAAAFGSSVVYSDNRSDPAAYPITADLKIVRLGDGEPVLVRERILDGRNFFVTARRDAVVYIMPPNADPDGAAPGLYVQDLF